jgi:hypothetical protein
MLRTHSMRTFGPTVRERGVFFIDASLGNHLSNPGNPSLKPTVQMAYPT